MAGAAVEYDASRFVPEARDLEVLRQAAAHCRGCPLHEPATQAVFGEGPAKARVVFVGEQPGDREDLAGQPFVGPAGRELDRALDDVGIDRSDAYVTNAVKHFKFKGAASGASTRSRTRARTGPAARGSTPSSRR
jgi:uracil-DNA glycosylase